MADLRLKASIKAVSLKTLEPTRVDDGLHTLSRRGIPHGARFQLSLRECTHAELRMIPHAPFDDLRDVFQRWAVLPQRP